MDQPAAEPAAPPPVAPSRVGQARAALGSLTTRVEPTWIGRLWSRLLEVEFVDRAVALAAKAFVSFLPGIILIAALSPESVRIRIMENLGRRFGISGQAMDMVRQAFASAAQTRAAAGVLGTILTIAFMVSFITALQRTYLRAWRRPPGGGAKNKGRAVMWLAGVIALIFVIALVRGLIHGSVGEGLAWVVALLCSIVLWWWTARLMTRAEIRWRPLLPTAVLTGIGSWLYTLASSVWMPWNVLGNYTQFGAFGIALALVTWFTGFAFVIVIAAVLAPALADGDGAVARWLREDRPDCLEPGAPPPLPPPSRPLRLSDAFGLGRSGATSGDGAATSDP